MKEIEPSKELAYWVGAVQTDGSLKIFTNKKTGYTDVRVSMHTATDSLPMVRKVQGISSKILSRNGKIWKERQKANWPYQDAWEFHVSIKRLLYALKLFDIRFGDPPKPPAWCASKKEFLGAYLAGVIDGDGSVWLTKNKNKRLFDCRVKISSGKEQTELDKSIKNFLNCKTRLIPRNVETRLKTGKTIKGKGFDLEFLFSSKNLDIVEKYILPQIAIQSKKDKVQYFIDSRMASVA